MKSMEEITSELMGFVQEHILDKSVQFTADTPFKDIGVDSFSIIQLVLFIERKYQVVMEEDDLTADNLNSIQTLAEFTFKR